ncbi:non-homologous end-joining DNA ligase [Pseudonocardia sp. H11422]|uniref:non-homologous end-joining DNA ligase n=1 Tax=Pseudonocardia sp. H11422 TaxID=2835866 RepID=UPI0027E21E55|nr:non-homologous end-joining DNA ligase [Pseudonocardia sp. H11422]
MSSRAEPRWPPPIAPMLARLGAPPVNSDGSWAIEYKWDGVRGVVTAQGEHVRVRSRNATNVTGTFPELNGLSAALGGRAVVLDGEVVALDRRGRPDFGRIQRRLGVSRPSARLLAAVPVVYVVFDLLSIDGTALLDQPYEKRRASLDALELAGPLVQVPPYVTGLSGAAMLRTAAEHGLEGIVAKKLDSTYRPGRRSPLWRKSPLRNRTSVVIGGWTPGQGERTSGLGALLLGLSTPAGLRYVGHCGTGWDRLTARQLQQALSALARPDSPFAGPLPPAEARAARWVAPVLVGDVEYRALTTEGRLRHPSWKGLRPDLMPGD